MRAQLRDNIFIPPLVKRILKAESHGRSDTYNSTRGIVNNIRYDRSVAKDYRTQMKRSPETAYLEADLIKWGMKP